MPNMERFRSSDGYPLIVDEILRKALEKGVETLVGIDLGKAALAWMKVNPDNFGDLINNARALGEKDPYPYDGFVVIDELPRPIYAKGKQVYEDDPFSRVLWQLRTEGKIKRNEKIPQGSRFDTSWNEIYEHVLPKIADLLEVDKSKIRLPKTMEMVILMSMVPHMGAGNTWEWLHDRGVGETRMTMNFELGSSHHPWVKKLPYMRKPQSRKDNLGFRPIILASNP